LSVETDSLVVRVDFDDRGELLATDRDVYYVTDHYVGYNAVLVRLSRINLDVARLTRQGLQVCDPPSCAPFASVEAPLTLPGRVPAGRRAKTRKP